MNIPIVNRSGEKWHKKHSDYSKQDWITKPSIFAEQVIAQFPRNAHVLELGAGHGQDGIYFASQSFDVLSTDLEISALQKNTQDVANISIQQLDLTKPLAFESESFDVVYAHLSLHYFSKQVTEKIFEDIYKILKPNGVLAFLVNSTDDPEFNSGAKLEEHLFEIDGSPKRFFTVNDAKAFAHKFDVIVADNNGETYKDNAKGIHNLVRFVGRKSRE